MPAVSTSSGVAVRTRARAIESNANASETHTAFFFAEIDAWPIFAMSCA
jgi:hypothetical protein